MSRSWLLYLDDLTASAEKIGRLIFGKSASSFSSDEPVFDAVLFNLQAIGEAMKNDGNRKGCTGQRTKMCLRS